MFSGGKYDMASELLRKYYFMFYSGGKYDMASELLRKVLQQNKSSTKVF